VDGEILLLDAFVANCPDFSVKFKIIATSVTSVILRLF